MPPPNYKSNFNAAKVVTIWLVLLAMLAIPWGIIVFQLIKDGLIFTLLVDIIILAVIWYTKIPLLVIIHRPENIIEYQWMKLWGQKRQVCIDINNASFYVDKTEIRGGKVDQLTIIDNDDPDNKIVITEITDGFDGDQIWYMHYELRQIRKD